MLSVYYRPDSVYRGNRSLLQMLEQVPYPNDSRYVEPSEFFMSLFHESCCGDNDLTHLSAYE